MTANEFLDKCMLLELNLEDKTIGEYSLKSTVYGKGNKITLIPANYQSLLMGYKHTEKLLEHNFKYYDLLKGNLRIMCNSGAILFEQYLPYIKSKGNVLLGGLGLGVVPRLLCEKDIVEKVTVVELSSEVIELCGFQHPKLEIVNGDFYSYLKNYDLNLFDYVYTDAYTHEGNVYEEIVIPTRKFLLEKFPTVAFDFWEEDQMKVDYLLKNKLISIQ